MHRALLLAVLALTLALPAAAGAQTTLLEEDAEGDPAAQWTVGTPPDGSEPWQPSDSSATKYRGNVFHGGERSFWTGVQPPNWPLVPTTAGPGTVIEGESILTLKEPILIPADGTSTLSYWSLFQNEGDDQGIAQIALDEPGAAWKNVKAEQATMTAAGDMDPRACDPTRPDHTLSVPFEEQKVSLAQYAGHRILIRFNLKYGAENRPLSQPCGWYLDDIAVTTTGTPGTGAAPPPTAPAAAKPTVAIRSLKTKGRRGTLSVTVEGGEVSDVAVTLRKGRRTVGRARAARLEAGRRKLTIRLSRKLRKGRYTVQLTGKAADGSTVQARRTVTVR